MWLKTEERLLEDLSQFTKKKFAIILQEQKQFVFFRDKRSANIKKTILNILINQGL